MKLDTIYYDFIKKGVKIYETRVYDNKRRKIKLLDEVTFIDRGDKSRSFEAIITELSYFSNFREAIESVGIEKVLPNAKSLEEGVEIYHQFPNGEGGTFKDAAEKYGVLRMKFELVQEKYHQPQDFNYRKARNNEETMYYPFIRAIPDENGEIKNGAFSKNKTIIDVVIDDKTTSIGESAFSSCENLKSVFIPDGVVHIGSGCFWRCSNLVNVNIPGGVTSIKYATFEHCFKLKTLTIPDSVKDVDDIGDYAFNHCRKLESVSIPKHLDLLPYRLKGTQPKRYIVR